MQESVEHDDDEKATILLLDDDPVYLSRGKSVLINAGYHVVSAQSAMQGLEILESGQDIDLIVTDNEMPGLTELDDGSGEYGAAWVRVTDAPETAEEYLLTFESENGSGDSFQMTAVKGLPMIMPYCTFTAPHGKMFLSWDMGGVTLREGDSIDFYCDAKIKAVWGRLP